MKGLLILFLTKYLIWASKISVRNELKNIGELLEEKAKEKCISPFYNISIQQRLTRLLSLDPIVLIEEMMEISDNDQGIASFWLYLDSINIDIIESLSHSKQTFQPNVVHLILINYKIWIIHILLYVYRDKNIENNEANGVRFLEKAMEFYNEWFRTIEINRNNGSNCMRKLYQQCQLFLNNDPKSLILSEYSKFKTMLDNKIKNRSKFKFHLENFFFLVNYLSSSYEDLFGLEWLSNQPSGFIFYYLYCFGFPALLNVRVNKIFKDFGDYFQMKRVVIRTLHDFLPIFDMQGDYKGILVSEFVNSINSYSEGEIIDIGYRLLIKINKYQ